VKIDANNKVDEVEQLKIDISTIKRTIKELKHLYNNNDIDINKFTELIEKYTHKLKTAESDLKKLRDKREKKKIKHEKKQVKKIGVKT